MDSRLQQALRAYYAESSPENAQRCMRAAIRAGIFEGIKEDSASVFYDVTTPTAGYGNFSSLNQESRSWVISNDIDISSQEYAISVVDGDIIPPPPQLKALMKQAKDEGFDRIIFSAW